VDEDVIARDQQVLDVRLVDLIHHEFGAELQRDSKNRREQANLHAGVHYLAQMGAMKQDAMDVCFYLPSLCSNRICIIK
jgi:hypothetical protein